MADENRAGLFGTTIRVGQLAGSVGNAAVQKAVVVKVFAESCGDTSVWTKVGASASTFDTLFTAPFNSFNYDLRRDDIAPTWG